MQIASGLEQVRSSSAERFSRIFLQADKTDDCLLVLLQSVSLGLPRLSILNTFLASEG